MYSSVYTIQYKTTLLFLVKFVVYFCARVSFTLQFLLCVYFSKQNILYTKYPNFSSNIFENKIMVGGS